GPGVLRGAVAARAQTAGDGRAGAGGPAGRQEPVPGGRGAGPGPGHGQALLGRRPLAGPPSSAGGAWYHEPFLVFSGRPGDTWVRDRDPRAGRWAGSCVAAPVPEGVPLARHRPAAGGMLTAPSRDARPGDSGPRYHEAFQKTPGRARDTVRSYL